MISVLTHEQLAEYEELGFLHSIPILSPEEVVRFRAEIEETCSVLDCMEQLIGPNVLLKSTRLFYKFGNSDSFVGWHQDGITEALKDAYVPAIWLGLTSATAENGCLR